MAFARIKTIARDMAHADRFAQILQLVTAQTWAVEWNLVVSLSYSVNHL